MKGDRVSMKKYEDSKTTKSTTTIKRKKRDRQAKTNDSDDDDYMESKFTRRTTRQMNNNNNNNALKSDEEQQHVGAGISAALQATPKRELRTRVLRSASASEAVIKKEESPNNNNNNNNEGESTRLLESLDMEGIVKYIKSGKAKNIIVLSGAGISVAAGIPDFRSPKTGLYHNLQKYNLPKPTSIFERSYFLEHPEPFFEVFKEIYLQTYKPTVFHRFVSLLHKNKLLLRNYTQNIDCLERIAGVPEDLLVESHGTLATATCVNHQCNKKYSLEFLKGFISNNNSKKKPKNSSSSSTKTPIPRCEHCNSLVKPDVLMFGEKLPDRFFKLIDEDFPKCDLLIVAGTSLKMQPFASLIDRVPRHTPRVLINDKVVGKFIDEEGRPAGFRFDNEDEDEDEDEDDHDVSSRRDVLMLGDCQSKAKELIQRLGWN